MNEDAEANSAKLAVEGDLRVTKVVRIIRKLRIDEVPQLWNVLSST
jgi:lipopolysaccharide/colanic/teichoic acid biosynthesis glycosyltransferase